MKTSTIVLIIVGVVLLIGGIIAIVIITQKPKPTTAVPDTFGNALTALFSQKMPDQGGLIGSVGRTAEAAGSSAGSFAKFLI